MADGLIDDRITTAVEDHQGRMWFGTRSGVSRFDGESFTHFTTADGLCRGVVNSAIEDRQGHLWFGMRDGVSRFDGEGFTCFTTADGLSHNYVLDIMEDRQGHLWFSTFGGGVSRYDGRVFQSLLQRDGLVHNGVHQTIQGQDGSYWIATEGGFTRFRPRISPPRIRITRVVAGVCIPANHVGGDFFQYFPENGKLSIAMADVTGHAMEAAVPVMMFSGLLKTEIKHAARLEDLFVSLNQTLCESLDSRTYVCFVMGELDLARLTLRLSNSGCPYPFHFRAAAGDVVELKVDAYPLGVRADSRYPVVEVQLEPGDRIVFCSDGIVEAGNEAEELFGFERTVEAIRRGCAQGLSGAALIEQILEEVKSYSADISQEDDQTIVTVGVGMSNS